MGDIALRTATTFVHSYASEDAVIEAPRQSDDRRDCEDFLQLGIDAFDWLIRADQTFREAIFDGYKDFDPAVENALRSLCQLWLKPCERARKRIEIQLSRGYKVDNLDRFNECCEEMQAIVRAQESTTEKLPAAMERLRDLALEEHRNGQTSEFV
jgi:hypothetical protein